MTAFDDHTATAAAEAGGAADAWELVGRLDIAHEQLSAAIDLVRGLRTNAPDAHRAVAKSLDALWRYDPDMRSGVFLVEFAAEMLRELTMLTDAVG